LIPRRSLPAALEHLRAALRRPVLRYGLSIGLLISAVLAIPWFGGSPAERAQPSRAVEGKERRPAPVPVPAPVPADEEPPPLPARVASALPEVRALGPDAIGATTSAAPTLYFFLSAASSVPVEITLRSEQASEPLFQQRLEPPVGAGLHALRLDRRGVRLEPGVTHRWSVALVPDPADRGADLVSGAALRRAAPDAASSAQLAAAAPAQRANLLAAAGYWYDAFDLVTQAIQSEPASEPLLEQRAALLEQAGLTGVAALLSAPAEPSASAAEGP
jgi:hypothetical protein